MTAPIPEVYILWHADCGIGETLARRIHAWLRPGNGLGPEVFYRCLPAPGEPARGLPLAIPGEPRCGSPPSAPRSSANLRILIPLIDAHLIADPLWREWLRRLGEDESRVALPVALDATAYNVAGGLRSLNFLRPAGLPLAPEHGPEDLEPVIRSMLKQLTESLCRLMLYADEGDGGSRMPRPKLKIFLSHAKADGVEPARRLRDYIYSQTQLAAFFDENDIAYGLSFSEIIGNDLSARETAAMIAVRSLKYAGRPWCRRELSLFRRPRRLTAEDAAVQRWRLHPTLVVDALAPTGETLGIPEFGNAPWIRWDDRPGHEEMVVTSLLRDVMLSAFHTALGEAVAGQAEPGGIVINWLPDPLTLLHIPRVRKGTGEFEVIYPGRGLSGAELDILFETFPEVTFRSFDDLTS